MRTWVLAAAFTVIVSSSGLAAPICVPSGSLGDFIALGSTGCSLGSSTLTDFSADPGLFGGGIDPVDVTVTLTDLGNGPRLDFGLSAVAIQPGPQQLDILIGYSISGPYAFGFNADLLMSGSDPGTGGAVTAVTEICSDGTLDPVSHGCSSGAPALLIVAHVPGPGGLVDQDGEFVGPILSFFDVFTEITVDRGLGDEAALDGTVTNQFATVPEPGMLVLVGSGVAGALVRRRRARAHTRTPSSRT